ncbi:site-specific integrase [Bacillus sp. V5-8f]|uniref:tyrosine-type recombinase/integrase n=1 Tax=Bacillus sp. V5-8f TaxID=2053044 RepID=UPI000C76341F|nr:site-specific integrase [Bacillus sp. V5-8f]PLT32534.1 hypothetical protein CUU64_18700 [Bacillus sp. V5-8f]
MRGTVKKSGSSWYVQFDLGKDPQTGKRKQKKKRGFKTQKEAQKYLNEQLNAIHKGTFFEPKDITFSEYVDYWFENYAVSNTSQKTMEVYSYIIKQHLKPSLGHFKISKLLPSHLQEYYSKKLKDGKIEGGGLSAQSVKHHHRLISKVLKDAVKWEFLTRNVAESVEPPKTKKTEMHTWDSYEVKTFLYSSRTSTYYWVYLTAIYTGMRRGEILGLRWQDVDFENHIIYVRQTMQPIINQGLTFKEPKSGKGRSITITPFLTKELKKLYKKQLENKLSFGSSYQDQGLVFSQVNGNPLQPSEVSKKFLKAIEAANLHRIRFHDLRHTHATLMLQQGVHPKVVSERLGHSTISITLDIYSHVLPNMQKEAANQFDQLLDSL